MVQENFQKRLQTLEQRVEDLIAYTATLRDRIGELEQRDVRTHPPHVAASLQKAILQAVGKAYQNGAPPDGKALRNMFQGRVRQTSINLTDFIDDLVAQNLLYEMITARKTRLYFLPEDRQRMDKKLWEHFMTLGLSPGKKIEWLDTQAELGAFEAQTKEIDVDTVYQQVTGSNS